MTFAARDFRTDEARQARPKRAGLVPQLWTCRVNSNSKRSGSVSGSGEYRAKVLLVEDQAVVRLGIAQLIAQQPDMVVCAQLEDAPEAIGAIAASSPDVVVVDLTLKTSDGLELVKDIRAQYSKLPVLVLSGHSESIYAELSLRAGAKGYVMKTEPLSHILTAIRRVLSGGVYLSELMTAKLLQQQTGHQTTAETSPLQRLTDRERQVLHLIGQWQSTRQIASTLHLSIKTVEHYRERIKEKLNLASASELVQYAVRWTQSPAPPGPEPDSDR